MCLISQQYSGCNGSHIYGLIGWFVENDIFTPGAENVLFRTAEDQTIKTRLYFALKESLPDSYRKSWHQGPKSNFRVSNTKCAQHWLLTSRLSLVLLRPVWWVMWVHVKMYLRCKLNKTRTVYREIFSVGFTLKRCAHGCEIAVVRLSDLHRFLITSYKTYQVRPCIENTKVALKERMKLSFLLQTAQAVVQFIIDNL